MRDRVLRALPCENLTTFTQSGPLQPACIGLYWFQPMYTIVHFFLLNDLKGGT